MSKKLILALLIAQFCGSPAHAQQDVSAKINPLIQQARKASTSRLKVMGSAQAVDSTSRQIKVLVRVRPGTTREQLLSIDPGIAIGTVSGEVATARLSLDLLDKLASDPAVVRISPSLKYKPLNDVARSSTTSGTSYLGSLSTHGVTGVGSFDGTGVVVGIVDTGIDFRHSDFYTGSGASATSRILYLWDPFDAVGPAPASFGCPSNSYGVIDRAGACGGSEWTQAQITTDLRTGSCASNISNCSIRERDTSGHGTHVAGSAAGDGSTTTGTGKYAGMAPGADIIAVKAEDTNGDLSDADICDGVAYIFAKAAALGKPAVVNLSLGGHVGPHDGSSDFESCITAQTGAGKVVAVAAGNDGPGTFHATRNGGGTLSWTKNGIGLEYIDFWHDAGDAYSLTIAASPCTSTTVVSGAMLNTAQSVNFCNASVTVYNAPTGFGNIFGGTGALGKEILVIINDTATDPANYTFTFTRTASAGTGRIDGWAALDRTNNTFPASEKGYTVGIPGTAPGVITVGAFTSRVLYDSPLASTASFSSIGPNRIGTIKPDITAPGTGIYSSFSQSFSNSGWTVDSDGIHLAFRGTSMATPITAGAIALLLQQNPTMTTTQVRAALQARARTDTHTSGTPSSPNNTWGAGKLMATPPAYPAPTGVAGSTLTSSSIRWSWADISNEENYRIRNAVTGSTVGFASKDATFFDQTGLTANTSYSVYIEAYNLAGSSRSLNKTAYTAAATPGTPVVTAVSSSTVFLSWSANGNPAGTQFELSMSTDNFTANFSTPIAFTAGFTATASTATQLAVATSYSFRLRARNVDLIATSFTATASTTTDAGPPTAILGLTAAAQGTSSITWTWVLQPGTTAYNLYDSGDNSLGSTALGSYTRIGQLPNTLLGLKVQGTNGLGLGPLSAASTRYTLAGAPNSFSVTSITSHTFLVDWDSSNPGGTQYQTQIWTQGGSTTTATVSIQQSTFSNLVGGTTYFVLVRASNGDAILGAAGPLQTTVTLAPPPGVPTGLAGAALGTSSITWSWATVPNATSYKLYPSTGGAAISVSGTSQNQTGLAVNTAYSARVSGFSSTAESAQSSSVTVHTLAAVPSALYFDGAGTTFVNVYWDDFLNPAGTFLTVEAVDGSVVASSRTAGIDAVLSGLLPNTEYTTRVRAENSAGVQTAYAPTIISTTLANPPASLSLTALSSAAARADWSANGNPAGTQFQLTLSSDGFTTSISTPLAFSAGSAVVTKILENLIPGATYQVRVRARNKALYETALASASVVLNQDLAQTITPGAGGTVSFGNANLVIPPAAFAQTIALTLAAPGSFPSPDSNATVLVALSVGIEITNDLGLQPLLPVRLTISYPDPLPPGVRAQDLILARYDPATGKWLPLPSTVDTVNKTVSSNVTHFSLFQVMSAAPAAALTSAVKAYPNPVRPSQGQSMNFSGVPAGGTLSIYTYRGDLIRTLTAAGAITTWDGRTSGGQKAASGVYLVLIKAGGESKIIRVMVER